VVVSSADFCGCYSARALPADPGVAEKIDRQARDFAKHGDQFEAIEWATAAKWLGGIK
jgi:hypothetical protein